MWQNLVNSDYLKCGKTIQKRMKGSYKNQDAATSRTSQFGKEDASGRGMQEFSKLF